MKPRRGRPPLAPEKRRTVDARARFTEGEAHWIDELRGTESRSAFVRRLVLEFLEREGLPW